MVAMTKDYDGDGERSFVSTTLSQQVCGKKCATTFRSASVSDVRTDFSTYNGGDRESEPLKTDQKC